MSRLLSISTKPVPLVTNTKLALEAVDSILLSLIVIPSTAKDPVNTAAVPLNVKLASLVSPPPVVVNNILFAVRSLSLKVVPS